MRLSVVCLAAASLAVDPASACTRGGARALQKIAARHLDEWTLSPADLDESTLSPTDLDDATIPPVDLDVATFPPEIVIDEVETEPPFAGAFDAIPNEPEGDGKTKSDKPNGDKRERNTPDLTDIASDVGEFVERGFGPFNAFYFDVLLENDVLLDIDNALLDLGVFTLLKDGVLGRRFRLVVEGIQLAAGGVFDGLGVSSLEIEAIGSFILVLVYILSAIETRIIEGSSSSSSTGPLSAAAGGGGSSFAPTTLRHLIEDPQGRYENATVMGREGGIDVDSIIREALDKYGAPLIESHGLEGLQRAIIDLQNRFTI